MLEFLDRIYSKGSEYRKKDAPSPAVPKTPVAEASYDIRSVRYNNVYAINYDGEKNLGELGPIRRYNIDHDALRLRSWQLFLESEICQIAIKRFATWVIGGGLKLQAEPQTDVLETEKITGLDKEDFNHNVECRFRLYSKSRMADYANHDSFDSLAFTAFTNAKVAGDVLVVLRLIDNEVKVQLIDGCHVATPLNLSINGNDYIYPNGNKIRHGVELSPSGEHVAYHVKTALMQYERIAARGEKSGELMAYLVYGMKYRLDNVRGIPLITPVMETAKKMERYKEATLGSAEERQKIPFFIKHGTTSTGENPLEKQLSKVSGFGKNGDLPADVQGKQLANQVAATMNKSVYNMPQDSEMVALESKNELGFRDFYTVNGDSVFATINIPPNVAMSKYDANFSASRAALKDWEHTIDVERKDFSFQFYQPIYNFWLDVQVLLNKITAPGYLQALSKNNKMALEAYRNARFVGSKVPHIDPLKEVTAERLKLGTGADHIPLTTVEAATEALNGGDSYANMTQFADEMSDADELGIQAPQPVMPETNDPEDKKDANE